MIGDGKILVTGGSGFVGSHIVGKLLERDVRVIVPHRGDVVPGRLQDVSSNHQLQFRRNFDIRSAADVAELISATHPDVVIHSAAYGVQSGDQNFDAAVQTNVNGTANLLDACHRTGVGRLVLIGTGLEYAPRATPIDELVPLQADTLYGATKISAWMLADYYSRERKLPLVTVRPFSSFGPKEDSAKLIPHVIRHAIRDGVVKLSSGNQRRDYTYVSDVADAILIAADEAIPAGETFNVGSGAHWTVAGIAQKVVQLLGRDVDLQFGSFTPARADRAVFGADSSKIRAAGWTPRYSFEEGLRETIAWYSSEISQSQPTPDTR